MTIPLKKDKTALNKLLIDGVLSSKSAFIGPEVLHIDLTNQCNFNCIACWCRSPLLTDKAMPDWEKKLTLPLDIIKGVIDDLEQIGGLRQVKLVGGGEPFMHPNVLEIVEYIKSKDKEIEIDINTNFSLVDKETAEKLLHIGVDSLTISIWAGSAPVYASVHPNQKEETFYRIKDIMRFIYERKKAKGLSAPRIIIHDVIFNLNYKDLENMIEFALDTGADSVQVVPVDPVKDRTESLLLSGTQRKELLEIINRINRYYDPKTFRYITQDKRSVVLCDFNSFIRRVERLNIASGVYDEQVVEEIPCYVGWLFARIMATGNVVPCCKGHRMTMGNIYKNRFKEIWLSPVYDEFRNNGLKLSKNHPYFSVIGNSATAKTGCYNCDNLWQNMPMHKLMNLKKIS
ncbi:MAG: radical SAM protein [Candidatus Omnitrophota bacterium]